MVFVEHHFRQVHHRIIAARTVVGRNDHAPHPLDPETRLDVDRQGCLLRALERNIAAHRGHHRTARSAHLVGTDLACGQACSIRTGAGCLQPGHRGHRLLVGHLQALARGHRAPPHRGITDQSVGRQMRQLVRSARGKDQTPGTERVSLTQRAGHPSAKTALHHHDDRQPRPRRLQGIKPGIQLRAAHRLAFREQEEPVATRNPAVVDHIDKQRIGLRPHPGSFGQGRLQRGPRRLLVRIRSVAQPPDVGLGQPAILKHFLGPRVQRMGRGPHRIVGSATAVDQQGLPLLALAPTALDHVDPRHPVAAGRIAHHHLVNAR